MLCTLDKFIFSSHGVSFDSVKRSFEFGFKETQLIDDDAIWAATGTFRQNITLAGSLVAQPNSALLDLEAMAKAKKPVTLAFESGKALQVVILNIEEDQSLFLKNGGFLKQDFVVSLGVVYGYVY